MNALERLRVKRDLRVFVTAGAQGIGKVIALAFLDAGARVVVTDIDQHKLDDLARAYPAITCFVADAASADQLAQVEKFVEEEFGGLDVLVNNAGIAGDTAPVDDIGTESWDETISVNLSGMFYTSKRFARYLRASHGMMINMASVAGRLGFGLRSPYAASKWGVVGFTKSLAVELGPEGVRVNAILPGIVEGPRIDRVINARARARGITYDQMRDELLSHVSLRQMVTADDIASMCLFLATPGGAKITGQALSVCGNVEVL